MCNTDFIIIGKSRKHVLYKIVCMRFRFVKENIAKSHRHCSTTAVSKIRYSFNPAMQNWSAYFLISSR